MQIETQRLILTPCSNEALSTYATKENKLGNHIGMYLEEYEKDNSLLGWGVWLVIKKETNKVIGDIGFKGKPDKENSIEVGYGISSLEQNQGYATESLKAIIEWAFNSNLIQKITAECALGNIPSIRVLVKVNMKIIKRDDTMIYWELTPAWNATTD